MDAGWSDREAAAPTLADGLVSVTAAAVRCVGDDVSEWFRRTVDHVGMAGKDASRFVDLPTCCDKGANRRGLPTDAHGDGVHGIVG